MGEQFNPKTFMATDRTPTKGKDVVETLLKSAVNNPAVMTSWPKGHIPIKDLRPNTAPCFIGAVCISAADTINFVSKTTHKPGRLRPIMLADGHTAQDCIKVSDIDE